MSPESARPHGGRHADAGVPAIAQPCRAPLRAAGRLPLSEGAHHPESLVAGPTGRPQLADRLVHGGGERTTQGLFRPRLQLPGPPAGPHGRRPQRVEEHGLADATQAGEHDRAFRSSAGHPFEDDVEGVELLVATGELGGRWPAPGA